MRARKRATPSSVIALGGLADADSAAVSLMKNPIAGRREWTERGSYTFRVPPLSEELS